MDILSYYLNAHKHWKFKYQQIIFHRFSPSRGSGAMVNKSIVGRDRDIQRAEGYLVTYHCGGDNTHLTPMVRKMRVLFNPLLPQKQHGWNCGNFQFSVSRRPCSGIGSSGASFGENYKNTQRDFRMTKDIVMMIIIEADHDDISDVDCCALISHI